MRALILLALAVAACSGNTLIRKTYVVQEQDAGLVDAGAPVDRDSGELDAGVDSGNEPDSASPDAGQDSAVDGAADAPAEAAADSGWEPPDGAGSNAQLGQRCDQPYNPCNSLELSWSETSGRYYPLSCERAPDLISSLCAFSCDDGRGYPDNTKAADCAALGGACELSGMGLTLYCIK